MADLLTPKPQAIASYDYYDLAAGTGVKRYYGAAISGTTLNTTEYVLSDQIVYSGDITTTVSGALLGSASGNPRIQEIPFDLYYNMPQTIEGKGVVNLTVGVLGAAVDQSSIKVDTTAILRRIDTGGGITDLVSGSVHYQKTLPLGVQKSEVYALALDIPRTGMKKGETLRLAIDQHAMNMSDATGNRRYRLGFGNDPKDRNDTPAESKIIVDDDTTMLVFDLPYSIRM